MENNSKNIEFGLEFKKLDKEKKRFVKGKMELPPIDLFANFQRYLDHYHNELVGLVSEIFGIDQVKPEILNYKFRKLNFTIKKTWIDLLEEIQPDFIYHLIGVYGKRKNIQSFNINTSSFFSFKSSSMSFFL